MGTRMFCDHCGNTITTPNVFCYGPYSEVQELLYPSSQGVGVAGAVGAAGAVGGCGGGGTSQIVLGAGQRATARWITASPASSVTQVPVVASKLIKVDLCNVCVPIWTERVRNLTKASDPDV